MRKLIGGQTTYSADSKTPSDTSLSLLPSLDPVDIEELALLSAEISARFLFTTCLHTRKSTRGVASDWYEALFGPLKVSKQARLWFGQCVLLDHPQRFCEYLLQRPSAEVRSVFVNPLLVTFMTMALGEGPGPPIKYRYAELGKFYPVTWHYP